MRPAVKIILGNTSLPGIPPTSFWQVKAVLVFGKRRAK